jgi:hypothetical protein
MSHLRRNLPLNALLPQFALKQTSALTNYILFKTYFREYQTVLTFWCYLPFLNFLKPFGSHLGSCTHSLSLQAHHLNKTRPLPLSYCSYNNKRIIIIVNKITKPVLNTSDIATAVVADVIIIIIIIIIIITTHLFINVTLESATV